MPTSHDLRWAEALAGLNAQDQAKATALRDRFAELGAVDPEGWALSEVTENIPQLARFLALRSIWPDLIDSWTAALENIPAAARLLAAGADREDLTKVARIAAYETAFGLLFNLTASTEASADPGWSLRETGEEGRLTGRTLLALHEDLLSMGPSSSDGQDLFS